MEVTQDYIEKIILKTLFIDKVFLTLFVGNAKDLYFENTIAGKIFKSFEKFFNEYKEIPDSEIIINSFENTEDQYEVKELINDIQSLDIDIAKNIDFIYENTENWLTEQSLKQAVLDTASLIKNKERDKYASCKHLFEEALTKNLKKSIGLDYFNTIQERLKRILSASKVKIPTYYSQFDEFLNGGFPPFTLSIIAAAIHGNKSSIKANWARRQALNGFSPVIISLEMAEDAFAARIDSGISGLDINRIYNSKKKELIESLKNVRKEYNGNLYIKQFATGTVNTNDIKAYLYELQLRGVTPGPIYVDYLNLMKPTFIEKEGNLYTKNKRVSEELRALSFEFETAVISSVQLTTEGMQIAVANLDYWHVAECLDPNSLVYKWIGKYYIIEKMKNLKEGDKILGSHGLVDVLYIFPKKRKKKYKIKTKSGKILPTSNDHKFPTDLGLKSIKSGLSIGDKLNVIK